MNPGNKLETRAKQQGFTLLEVVVSMVLLAATGIAVFSWINSSIMNLAKVKEHVLKQQASRNGLALMRTVNPMNIPAGESKIGSFVVHWRSQPLKPPTQGVGHPFGESLYELALFNTHVWILLDNQEVANFDLRQVGYRQNREFVLGF